MIFFLIIPEGNRTVDCSWLWRTFCFLTLRDFTSPSSHQWDPIQRRRNPWTFWGSLPRRLQLATSHWSQGGSKLLHYRLHSWEPTGPEDPKALRPHMKPALELSPSAPQHQQGSKKLHSSLLETHECVSNRLSNSQVSSNILVLT